MKTEKELSLEELAAKIDLPQADQLTGIIENLKMVISSHQTLQEEVALLKEEIRGLKVHNGLLNSEDADLGELTTPGKGPEYWKKVFKESGKSSTEEEIAEKKKNIC